MLPLLQPCFTSWQSTILVLHLISESLLIQFSTLGWKVLLDLQGPQKYHLDLKSPSWCQWAELFSFLCRRHYIFCIFSLTIPLIAWFQMYTSSKFQCCSITPISLPANGPWPCLPPTSSSLGCKVVNHLVLMSLGKPSICVIYHFWNYKTDCSFHLVLVHLEGSQSLCHETALWQSLCVVRNWSLQIITKEPCQQLLCKQTWKQILWAPLKL